MLFLAALLFTASADAKPVKIERDSDALKFSYEWPAEAGAIPALARRLRSEAAAAFQRALNDARDEQEAARDQKREFSEHFYSLKWTAAGRTARLLSLQNRLDTFSGGAHPNHNSGALLWDRKSNREIAFGALFLRATAFAAVLGARYCRALDAERRIRREGEKFGGEFDRCPKFSDLAIAPVDRDRNGRFDTIDFVASPYTAGPYAEGEYDIRLPVTSGLIRGIRPEYRSSFEAHRQ